MEEISDLWEDCRMPSESLQPANPTRSLGLDAVRGLAILLMCVSGNVPGLLPNWMYHGYYPQMLPEIVDGMTTWTKVGATKFIERWPSYTWVDWVFPGFLFAMGAAIPMALSARRASVAARRASVSARGETNTAWGMMGYLFSRWIGLIAFAVIVRQISPHFIDRSLSPTALGLALLGFVLLFAIYMRLPKGVSRRVAIAIRVGGVLGMLALIAWINIRVDRVFRWSDHDIIILLLAHTWLIGAVSWVLIRRGWLRLLLLLPVATSAHMLDLNISKYPDYRWWGQSVEWLRPMVEWVRVRLDMSAGVECPHAGAILNLSPLWSFTWLKYLWIVVPGTVVGDLLMRRASESSSSASASSSIDRNIAFRVTGLSVMAIVIVWAGLRHYGHPHEWPGVVRTPWLALWGIVPAWIACVGLRGVWRNLMRWAAIAMTIGLLLSVMPASAQNGFLEGGISKGPPSTLSYYVTSFGMSVMMLVVFSVWSDVRRSRALVLLERNGQNPMLAYVAIRNLLLPIVMLPLLGWLGFEARTLDRLMNGLSSEPWVDFGWTLTKTLALAYLVAYLTHRRVVWRA